MLQERENLPCPSRAGGRSRFGGLRPRYAVIAVLLTWVSGLHSDTLYYKNGKVVGNVHVEPEAKSVRVYYESSEGELFRVKKSDLQAYVRSVPRETKQQYLERRRNEEVAKELQRHKAVDDAERNKSAEASVSPGMVRIAGGTYWMGDTFGDGDADEKPVHSVTLNNFFLGKTEVTQSEFRTFVTATGYRTTAERTGDGCFTYESETSFWSYNKSASWQNSLPGQDDRHPVGCVSWFDAVEYCNWRSKREGLMPVYAISGNKVSANWNANGYRLPTEAEWEYAARSCGKNHRFGNGQNTADPSQINFDGHLSNKQPYSVTGEYRWKATAVGNFHPNDLGLYDMSGNIMEWVWDWYDEKYYTKTGKDNPRGPGGGEKRVIRGGSWVNAPNDVRAEKRSDGTPTHSHVFIGFRLARKGP